MTAVCSMCKKSTTKFVLIGLHQQMPVCLTCRSKLLTSTVEEKHVPLTKKYVNLNGKRKEVYILQQIAEQSEVCAICGCIPNRWCLDHDHYTGNPRGALCTSCNLRLSGVDDIVWLERAFDYIQKWLRKPTG